MHPTEIQAQLKDRYKRMLIKILFVKSKTKQTQQNLKTTCIPLIGVCLNKLGHVTSMDYLQLKEKNELVPFIDKKDPQVELPGKKKKKLNGNVHNMILLLIKKKMTKKGIYTIYI